MTVREHTHPASLLVRRLTRFVGIGVVNTLLDLALYALLEPSLGLLPATIVSTGCAMVFSYVANAFLAFGATRLSWRSAVQFFGLSALNLWIVQPVVIWLLDRVLHPVVHDDYHRALLAKLAATAVSMTLNFLVYDRYIWPRTSVAQPQDGPATP